MKVKIHSTEELHTVHDGDKGTILKRDFMGKEGFHRVLTWRSGTVEIFHESQLEEIEDDVA